VCAASSVAPAPLRPRVELLGTVVWTVRCIPHKAEYRHGTDRVQVEWSKGAKNSAKRVKSTWSCSGTGGGWFLWRAPRAPRPCSSRSAPRRAGAVGAASAARGPATGHRADGAAATRDQATSGRPAAGHRALCLGLGRIVAARGGTPPAWARGCDSEQRTNDERSPRVEYKGGDLGCTLCDVRRTRPSCSGPRGPPAARADSCWRGAACAVSGASSGAPVPGASCGGATDVRRLRHTGGGLRAPVAPRTGYGGAGSQAWRGRAVPCPSWNTDQGVYGARK